MSLSTSIFSCCFLATLFQADASLEKNVTNKKSEAVFEVRFRIKGEISDGNQGLKLSVGPDLKLYAGRGVVLDGKKLADALKGYKTSEKRIVTLYVSEGESISLSQLSAVLSTLKEHSDKTKKTFVFVNLAAVKKLLQHF